MPQVPAVVIGHIRDGGRITRGLGLRDGPPEHRFVVEQPAFEPLQLREGPHRAVLGSPGNGGVQMPEPRRLLALAPSPSGQVQEREDGVGVRPASLRGRRQPVEQIEGLPVVGHGLGSGVEPPGPIGGQESVAERPLPVLRPEPMVCEEGALSLELSVR
jgi:hypothetical protein